MSQLRDINLCQGDQAIEIADRIWWVSHYQEHDVFQCHVHLIEHGDQLVLFDPGSTLTFHHSSTTRKFGGSGLGRAIEQTQQWLEKTGRESSHGADENMICATDHFNARTTEYPRPVLVEATAHSDNHAFSGLAGGGLSVGGLPPGHSFILAMAIEGGVSWR